jgi:asparagine synthase (glutamine-hydrolysing)
MCGIAGVLGDGFPREHVPTMLDRIRHRGPDGRDEWTTEGCRFGHVRLKVLDLSEAGAQPMVDPETGNVLVYNGEIYNYVELKRELAGFYDFRSTCDTEVLLASYRRWGIDCLPRLRGMFALALWDPARRQALLARDRLGIKPLYFRKFHHSLAFCSEIKGLVALPGASDDYRPQKVVDFILARHLDTDGATMFADVEQLRPGTYRVADVDGRLSEARTYWSPPEFGERRATPETLHEFREFLRRVVEIHLRSDVQLGVLVSGGLDSSSVACLSAPFLPEGDLHTYSSILEHKTEENALIPLIQRQVRATTHDVQLDGTRFLEDLPRVIYHHDEPIPDASMYVHYMLCELAKRTGTIVLLSGNGGDEVFSGYASYVYSYLGRLLKRGALASLLGRLRKFARNRSESRATLAGRALQYALPLSFLENRRRKRGVGELEHTTLASLAPSHRFYYARDRDPYRANYLNNLSHWTVPPFLHYEDRNAAAFGLEVRVPLLDHELIEMVAAFAADDLLAGRTKSILRGAMRGIVPDPVLEQRGKFGFAAPLVYFVRQNREGLSDGLHDVLRDVPFLKYEQSLGLCRSFLDGRDENRGAFWRTFTLAMWYQIYFNRRFGALAGEPPITPSAATTPPRTTG